MGARLWTALLVLAAVFAMHGLQCAAGDGDGSAAASAHVVSPAHLGAVVLTAPGPAHVGEMSVAGTPDEPMPGHGGAPHDTAAHLWTLCLAVLAAALAVLLTWLVPRARHLSAPALGYARARLLSLAPPRPPDLSAVCLLRI